MPRHKSEPVPSELTEGIAPAIVPLIANPRRFPRAKPEYTPAPHTESYTRPADVEPPEVQPEPAPHIEGQTRNADTGEVIIDGVEGLRLSHAS